MKRGDKLQLNKLKKPLLYVGGGLLGIYICLILIQTFIFSNRFGPFVKVAGVNVGGKSTKQTVDLVQKRWDEYKTSEITIEDAKHKVSEIAFAADVQKSIDIALNNQNNSVLTLSALRSQQYYVDIKLNNEGISDLLAEKEKSKSTSAEDAKLVLTPEIKIIPEKNGQKLLIPESRELIRFGLSEFKDQISLKIETVTPLLTTARVETLVEKAKSAVSTNVVAKSKYGDFNIEKSTLESWLKLKISKSSSEKEEVVTYFDDTKVNEWVNQTASKIDKTSQNAKLGTSNGKVVVVSPSQSGITTNKDDLAAKIQSAATTEKEFNINLNEKEPEITENKISELGLKELVSTGYTDFTGSPANRKVNIQVGASKFNGAIIKPGEEFSFNKILGPVEASTGFLPELVIKDNKTVPEYGGGLCQVSSTAFRAALNAGLPITARYAHAYPVSYYKPYGVDATIYLPWPDLKFKNDTGHYILIQTRIEGTKLSFDFYGEKVVRTIKFSGNQEASGAVDIVEKITPSITEVGARGKDSFTATFFRHIYDTAGKLISNDSFVSKYDSPEKYPH